jgi:hypothetical protein
MFKQALFISLLSLTSTVSAFPFANPTTTSSPTSATAMEKRAVVPTLPPAGVNDHLTVGGWGFEGGRIAYAGPAPEEVYVVPAATTVAVEKRKVVPTLPAEGVNDHLTVGGWGFEGGRIAYAGP